jgi:hypothetical protein
VVVDPELKELLQNILEGKEESGDKFIDPEE